MGWKSHCKKKLIVVRTPKDQSEKRGIKLVVSRLHRISIIQVFSEITKYNYKTNSE
jgi:ribosomal protein S15P/S13E